MHFIGFFGNAPTTSRQGTLPFYKNHRQHSKPIERKLPGFFHRYTGVPELADQTYSAFSLVITESNSV
jgi:hypothetical protein